MMLVMLSITLISATDLPTAKQDENITLVQFCPTCSYITISSITYPDNTISYLNSNMTRNGSTYEYLFIDTSQIGKYIYFVEGDKDGIVQGEALNFEINYSGKDLYTSQSIIYILLSVLLVTSSLVFTHLSSKVDFDAWNNKIQKKYEGKNYIKATLASVGFTFARETFMTIYFLMLPVVIMVRELTILAGIDSIMIIINIFAIIYSVGMIIIIGLFFGKIQEFIVNMSERIKNEKWGIIQ